MKFNWGTGIFIFIILFMSACAAFLIFANRQDNSLVESDYYARGLKYEDVIQKMRNTAALKEAPGFQFEKGWLDIRYPSDMKGKVVKGSVFLYRPSDRKLDFVVPLAFDTALLQHIPSASLHKGKYIIKLDWTMNDKSFYFEKEIYVE
ncbi:MAG: FixH family protein [Bacteroidota bacterium]|jgi:FixH